MDAIDNLNLSMMTEFTYDLAVRTQLGVLTTVSLSASNEIGSSNFSNELNITIPIPGDAPVCCN